MRLTLALTAFLLSHFFMKAWANDRIQIVSFKKCTLIVQEINWDEVTCNNLRSNVLTTVSLRSQYRERGTRRMSFDRHPSYKTMELLTSSDTKSICRGLSKKNKRRKLSHKRFSTLREHIVREVDQKITQLRSLKKDDKTSPYARCLRISKKMKRDYKSPLARDSFLTQDFKVRMKISTKIN